MKDYNQIQIVNYSTNYKEDFKNLNEEWIVKYFSLEEEDHKVLNDPQKYILKEGGFILLALYNGEVVGTCAVCLRNEKVYELSKMCVRPDVQGKNIGFLLCQAAILKAKDNYACKIYLETNSSLSAAVHLYSKLGFVELMNSKSKYARVNITMELLL